jgi:small GTP-binding protein
METDSKTKPFKVVLLGDSGVGKSSLVSRLCAETFNPDSEPTVGAAYFDTIRLIGEREIALQIWDTAGQEQYRSVAPLYYRKAAAAIVVWDMSRTESLRKAKFWIEEIQTKGEEGTMIVLVGNKSDVMESGSVREKEVESLEVRFLRETPVHLHEWTSARNGTNVAKVFDAIAQHCTDKSQERVRLTNTTEIESLVKEIYEKQRHRKSCCC